MTSWNRLFNHQREVLAALAIGTTDADRLRALSYEDPTFKAQNAIQAVHAGRAAPSNLGVMVAAARYESAGWMPYRGLNRWRRWKGGNLNAELLSVPDLVRWLDSVEHHLRR